VQIGDTDGLLLAKAMEEHMGREEWAELDQDEKYVEQASSNILCQLSLIHPF
jgi:hypothetical protein